MADIKILLLVSDFLDNKIEIIPKIPIIPARETDAEAPEIKIKIIIENIIK
jgi:hypothetical protein